MVGRKKTRAEIIIRTSCSAIFINLTLVGIKIFIGLASSSIAVVLDGLNNLTDSISLVVTIIGTKLSRKYERVEYFTTIVIAAMVLIAGTLAGHEAFEKILRPEHTEFSVAALVAIGLAVVAKLLLGRYVGRVGEKVDSSSLKAISKDSLLDVILSFGTLVGAGLSYYFGIEIGGFIGLLISIFIVAMGINIMIEAIRLFVKAPSRKKRRKR